MSLRLMGDVFLVCLVAVLLVLASFCVVFTVLLDQPVVMVDQTQRCQVEVSDSC